MRCSSWIFRAICLVEYLSKSRNICLAIGIPGAMKKLQENIYYSLLHSFDSCSYKENALIPAFALATMSKSINQYRSVLFDKMMISNCVHCVYAVCNHRMQYNDVHRSSKCKQLAMDRVVNVTIINFNSSFKDSDLLYTLIHWMPMNIGHK